MPNKESVKGLIIRSPWVEMMLDGNKTWEMRGTYTHIRGKIALIRNGSGLVVGTCNLVDVKGPLTRKEFQKNRRKAGLSQSEARWLPYDTTYAWVVKSAKKFRRPRHYKHPPVQSSGLSSETCSESTESVAATP